MSKNSHSLKIKKTVLEIKKHWRSMFQDELTTQQMCNIAEMPVFQTEAVFLLWCMAIIRGHIPQGALIYIISIIPGLKNKFDSYWAKLIKGAMEVFKCSQADAHTFIKDHHRKLTLVHLNATIDIRVGHLNIV